MTNAKIPPKMPMHDPDGNTVFCVSEEVDRNPDNGKVGIWRVDGIRHSCLVSRVSTAREARDKAIAEGAVGEWELCGIRYLAAELPEVFRLV